MKFKTKKTVIFPSYDDMTELLVWKVDTTEEIRKFEKIMSIYFCSTVFNPEINLIVF